MLSQTFRAIIHSRMQVGIERYRKEFPDADVVLFEPSRDDAEMFFANVFSYADRRRLSEHAYQRTREALVRRHDELAPILARHGVTIDRAVSADPRLTLVRDTHRQRIGAAQQLDRTLSRLETLLVTAERPAARRSGA